MSPELSVQATMPKEANRPSVSSFACESAKETVIESTEVELVDALQALSSYTSEYPPKKAATCGTLPRSLPVSICTPPSSEHLSQPRYRIPDVPLEPLPAGGKE